MPRFTIPSLLRNRLRFYQNVDVYRHQHLSLKERTMEHIIPVSCSSKDVQLDIGNLYMTNSRLNGFRSNYRFGGHMDETLAGNWKECQGCFRNTERRVFLPAHGHRLVAHVLWKMMDKYPELEQNQWKWIENQETWDRWLKTPWTPLERHVLEMNDAVLETTLRV